MNVNIRFENMDEYRELLQKAANQVEQLKQTLKQIETFELKVTKN